MLRRTSSRSPTTSCPATDAAPAVGLASVQSMLIVVVFPAPLGPRKPNTSPVATSKSTPLTASTSPKRLASAWTEIATCMLDTLRGRVAVLREDPVQRSPGLGQQFLGALHLLRVA